MIKAAVLSLLLSASLQLQAAEAQRFEIPSQDLATSLNQFAVSADWQIVFAPDLVKNLRGQALSGNYTKEEAIERLLLGTGLRYQFIGDQTVAIQSSAATSSKAVGTISAVSEPESGIRLAQAEATSASATAAQEPAASAQVNREETLDEITVTAQKRVERLQDVPISLTVLNSDLLEKTSIASVSDLGKMVPNFSFEPAFDAAHTNRITMRGILGDARNSGFESSVSVYLDGVYAGRSGAQNLKLMNVERVEVLRGPQGTLFGKNTIAGAINIVTRKPSEELEGKVTANLGNFDKRNLAGYVSGPVVNDRLYFGASFFTNNRDGYVTNLFGGDDLASENSDGGDFRLRFTGDGGFEANLRFEYMKDDYLSPYAEALSGGSTVTGNTTIFAPGIRTIDVDGIPRNVRDGRGVSLTLDKEWGGHTLSSITAYKKNEFRTRGDNDNSPLDFLYIDWTENVEFATQEFRLVSPTGGKLDYVAGLYFFKQDVDMFAPFTAGVDHPSPGVATVSADISTESGAAFAQANYHLTDRLTLTGGLRYTIERKKLKDYREVGPVGLGGAFNFDGTVTDKREDSDVSPMLSLGFAVNEDINVYAKAARGFKSGGWNADFISRSGALDDVAPAPTEIDLEPETATTYEIGFKGGLLERRLLLNLAAFYTDYQDLQVSSRIFDPATGTFPAIFTNAASSTIKGLEAEWTVRVTDGLSLSGGVGYIDAVFDSYADATVVGGLPVAFDGNKLPDVPKWTGSMLVEYQRPLVRDKALSVSFDYSYKDNFFPESSNNPLLEVDSRGVFGGRIGMTSDSFEVFLWGENLADKDYLVTKQNNPAPLGRGTWSMPRSYGVQLSYSF